MANQLDTKKVFSYLFIVGLAVLFALEWGPGSRGCDRAGRIQEVDVAATVNGREIPLKDFANAYGQQLNAFRRQGAPPELAKQLGMHKQVLDQLVSNELLAQAAEARGLQASDDDVLKVVTKQPGFQKDGKFDPERYQQALRDYEGSTAVMFEAKLRRQLAAQRMLELVESAAVVSDDEVKARYLKEGDTAKVTYVRFAPAMYAAKVGAPRPGEVDAWAKSHEQDISAFYEANKQTYLVPAKVKARQILLRVNRDDSSAKKDEAKTKLENVRKDLVDNKRDFAELAKQLSEDTETRAKGGDLGLVDRLQLPGAFADVLFALKPGEVSAVVETPLGFHLGVVEDTKPEEQKPLEAVKQEIATQLLVKSKAEVLAGAAAEKAFAEAKKGKALKALFPPAADSSANTFGIGAETKPEAKETGEFNASAESIPQLGAAPELQKEIFATKEPGLLPHLATVSDAQVIVLVDSRTVLSDADFDAKKEQLKLEATKAKQYEIREAFLKALKQQAQIVDNEKAIDRVVGPG